eukprot:3637405-Prymnesium_polylepis.1
MSARAMATITAGVEANIRGDLWGSAGQEIKRGTEFDRWRRGWDQAEQEGASAHQAEAEA